jgi:hypothetical protein
MPIINELHCKYEEKFQVTLYTALPQRMRTIFKDQTLAFYVFRKVHPMLASEFATAYHVSLISLKNEKAQLKVALR